MMREIAATFPYRLRYAIPWGATVGFVNYVWWMLFYGQVGSRPGANEPLFVLGPLAASVGLGALMCIALRMVVVQRRKASTTAIGVAAVPVLLPFLEAALVLFLYATPGSILERSAVEIVLSVLVFVTFCRPAQLAMIPVATASVVVHIRARRR